MHLRLIWVGRTRSEPLRMLVDDYLKRLARFGRCEITELREAASGDRKAVLETEGKRIIEALRPDSFVVLLDREGQQWSSEELAGEIERWQMTSLKEIAFVIGGHYGVSSEIKGRAGRLWSLSRLTFTHEMARLVLIEQLYRAHTITRGLPYQK